MKLKNIFTLLAGMFVLSSASAEAVDEPIELWNKTAGGNSADSASGITVDSKNNIIIIGTTSSFGAGLYDFWTIKYDPNGNMLWNKTAGGNDSGDTGSDVAVDSYDNIIVAGSKLGHGFLTIKYDPEGNMLWNKTESIGSYDNGYGVAVDSNDNIIVTGYIRSRSAYGDIDEDIWTIKYNPDGSILWNVTANRGSYDHAWDVAVDSKDNIIVTGHSGLDYDMWTIKYDSNGSLLWDKAEGGNFDEDGSFGVAVDSKDNIIITGHTFSFGAGDADIWTIKYDPYGNVIWRKTAGGIFADKSSGVAIDSNDNIIVVAYLSDSYNIEDEDFGIIKYDPDGMILWNKTAGGNSSDTCQGIVIDSDNNIIITGTTHSFDSGKNDSLVCTTGCEDTGKVWTIKYTQSATLLSKSNIEKIQQNQIPDSIMEKSNRFIISRVGEDFFKKYITLDYNQSKYYPPEESCIPNPEWCAGFLLKPYYLMVYSFKIPEKPYADGLMDFAVDMEGELISERDISGIPDCINKPDECDFPIDEAKAVDIAKEAGLKPGIKNFSLSFHWYGGDLKTYVWTVENTLSEYSGGKNGKTVVIDANSGRVHEVLVWEAESDTVGDGKESFDVENEEVFKNAGNVDEKNFQWKTYVIPGMIISGLILLFILFILKSKNEKHKN